MMIEFLGLILLVLAIYGALVYLVAKYTLDKLRARSGLFAAGIVTMFTGFICSKFVEPFAYETGELLCFVVFYGFLIMGLSGVVMMAVDILKAVNELNERVSRQESGSK